MAVLELNHQVHKYIGASTDTKPTAASNGTTAGSTFYEQETGIMYITYDGTNWVKKGEGHNVSGIGSGVKVVTTAGTDVALATSTAAKAVMIQAQTDNTSAVAVGASGVDVTIATGPGILLFAGEWTPWILIDNLADVYIDALVNGEGVRYIYLT